MVSEFTYDLGRSGSTDFVDRLVAFTFAGIAMDALEEGKSGLMSTKPLHNGTHSRPEAGSTQGGHRVHV